jgi:hypothetical protein
MSHRRPPVALLLFTFHISPRCDVAQTSACGIVVIYFSYKPFMWCRSDVRLWHSCYFKFWHKPFMRCRPDARLRHVFYFLPFEASLQTPDRSSSYFIGTSGGLPPDFLFIFLQCIFNVCVCFTNLLMCIMFTFVISYVQTVCEYIQSTHGLCPWLLFWPDVDEGDLMDEEFDSESDA